MADKQAHAPDIARYAHQLPDGTILYFESDGKRGQEGELPPNAGHSPSDLARRGFTFLDYYAYDKTRRALDPMLRAENADADELATAFDANIGTSHSDAPSAAQDMATAMDAVKEGTMNGQDAGMLTPEMMEILQQYANEGRLEELFQPFQQEQNVLGQQMQQAQNIRQQRSPQRGTPTGALFSGLANVANGVGGAMLQKKGLEGQAALGKRMQGDASGRVGAILRAMQQRKGVDPRTGLMTPAVDDATLAGLFAGG